MDWQGPEDPNGAVGLDGYLMHDQSECYLHALAQAWVARLLEVDHYALSQIADHRRGLSEVILFLKHGAGFGAAALAVLLEDSELARKYPERRFGTLDQFMAASALNRDGLGQLLLEIQQRNREVARRFFAQVSADFAASAAAMPAVVRDNLSAFCVTMGFGATEERLLSFVCARQLDADFRDFLSSINRKTDREAAQCLAAMLNGSATVIQAALSPGGCLQRAGLAHLNRNLHDMEDKVDAADELGDVMCRRYDSVDQLMAAFLTPAGEVTLCADDFAHLGEMADYARNYLATAVRERERGINLILYGPPGSGKTEFARLLAKSIGAAAYEVDAGDDKGESVCGSDRVARFRLQQHMLSRRADCVLIFDEIEDVFPESSFSALASAFGGHGRSRAVTSKGWMNDMLENNPVPTIWITNQIRHIDRAYLRRFGLHMEFDLPPLSARLRMARRHVSGLPVAEATIEAIAEHDALSPAQIATAARTVVLARRAGDNTSCLDPNRMLRDVLQSSLEAAGQKDLPKPQVRGSAFELRFLNVTSRVPLDRLLAAIRPEQSLPLLFHGRPGTGKTSLAAQIARQIARPLLSYRVSDLQSKWVGETEQNIAAMFRQAVRDGSVLFLDEADSLLRSREAARAGWEVSQVNEILQQMEQFPGIFICATNLLDDLDPASIRRFTLKLEFLPLSAPQRLALLARECGVAPESLPASVAGGVAALDDLTVGDFSAVARQQVLLGECFSPTDWVARLQDECAYRTAIFSRPIGFVRS